MNFTHKINVRPVVSGVLAVTVMGLIGWINHVAPAPAPIVAAQDAFAAQKFVQTSGAELIVPAIYAPAPGFQVAKPEYQPASWYNRKSWWKSNAPIIGGAGGGALIGGLAGGGKGALIGGAVGGGGGYLYKRHRNHHH